LNRNRPLDGLRIGKDLHGQVVVLDVVRRLFGQQHPSRVVRIVDLGAGGRCEGQQEDRGSEDAGESGHAFTLAVFRKSLST
jgi:hypothetical protein